MQRRNHESEASLLARLRAGDETAFAGVVDGLHGRLVALARTFTSSPALAEDIVQETWLGVIRGLPGFEGRSSLRTWIFSILVRRARTLAAREARRAEVPIEPNGAAGGEWQPGAGRVGLWSERLTPWDFVDPAALLQSKEALHVIRDALEALPAAQRQVVILRDVEDVAPADICNILGLSGTNLRVLLHRGRARIRRALDDHLRDHPRQARPGAPRAAAAGAARTDGSSRTSGKAT